MTTHEHSSSEFPSSNQPEHGASRNQAAVKRLAAKMCRTCDTPGAARAWTIGYIRAAAASGKPQQEQLYDIRTALAALDLVIGGLG